MAEHKLLLPEAAAGVVMLYFVGMTCGRFLAGIAASKLHSWRIIFIGQSVPGVALIVLLLPGNLYLAAVGLFLIGFGNGPLFPNVNYLAPELFGAEKRRPLWEHKWLSAAFL